MGRSGHGCEPFGRPEDEAENAAAVVEENSYSTVATSRGLHDPVPKWVAG
jgi:hypothetical protein